MDLTLFARKIVNQLGGLENIRELTYADNIIRFRVAEKMLVRESGIAHLLVCKEFYEKNGEYYLTPAYKSGQLFKAILTVGEFSGMDSMDELLGTDLLSKVGINIRRSVEPILPIYIINGILTFLVFILSGISLSKRWVFFYDTLIMINGAIYLLIPFLLGAFASRQLGCSKLAGGVLAGTFLFNTYLMLDVTAKTVFSDPRLVIGMYLCILPLLLSIYVYRELTDLFASMPFLKPIRVLLPSIALLIMVAAVSFFLIPLGTVLDNYISFGILFIFIGAPVFGSAVLGLLTPILILLGFFYGSFPITYSIQQLGEMGYVIGPGFMAACVCQGVVGIYAGIMEQNRRRKWQAFLCGILACTGILFPVVAAVNMRKRRYLASGMVGSLFAGFYYGIAGITSLSNVLPMIFGILIGVVVSFLCIWFFQTPSKTVLRTLPKPEYLDKTTTKV